MWLMAIVTVICKSVDLFVLSIRADYSDVHHTTQHVMEIHINVEAAKYIDSIYAISML
jgi:hypothetical protein